MARIMLVVDHKWRDLPSSVYLKLILEKRYSHVVKLVRLGEDKLLVPGFRPNMVVYNNLYETGRNAYARYLKSRGIKIVILPTEGITFSDEQTLLFTHKYSGIEFVDLYLAWNELMRNAILENLVMPEKNVVTAGNSRFDFYVPPLARLLKTREQYCRKYGMPPDRSNILISTNFANAEFWPDTSFLEKNLAEQRANGIPVFSDAGKLAKYEYDYRQKMFELIGQVAQERKPYNLLIKYHPSERMDLYRRFVDDLRRINEHVYLIEGEYIWDLLHISDLVVQRCSTVAIEAWLMGKRTVELELMPSLDHFLQPRYRKGSFCIGAASDLVQLMDSLRERDNGALPDEMRRFRKETVERLVHRPDGATSKRIAEIIDTLVRRDAVPIAGLGAFTVNDRLKRLIRTVFGMKGYDVISNLSKFKLGDYLGRYDKRFTGRDIDEWTENLFPFV